MDSHITQGVIIADNIEPTTPETEKEDVAYRTLNQAELGTMIEWISEIENSLNAMVFTVSLAYGAGEGLGVETRLRLAIEDIVKARRAFKQLLNDLEDNGQDNE